MKIFLDPFDTKILKKDVYKLYLQDEESENIVLESIKEIKKGIIFCFTIFSPRNSNLLQQAGFNLISIRNTYKLNLNSLLEKNIEDCPNEYKILNKLKSIKGLQKKDLNQLADTIYKTSRYSKDSSLGRNQSRKIYTNWLNNSLYNNYASEAFLVFDQSTAIGIITIKIKDKIGSIDLLGIRQKYQNKGLATYLLKKAVDYLITQDINDIFVTTEGENIPANIFYQKNNFILQNVELVYHKHI